MNTVSCGYTGQRLSTISSSYLLGNGYREYNPVIKRFAGRDTWSPFGAGGVHGFAYSGCDPVNQSDPSGHVFIPWWFIIGMVTDTGVEAASIGSDTAIMAVCDGLSASSPRKTPRLGKYIGKGSQKDVFMSADSDNLVVALFRKDAIGCGDSRALAESEFSALNELKEYGLSTVKATSVIQYEEQFGIEMEYIDNAIDSIDIMSGKFVLPSSHEFNKNLLKNLSRMIEIIKDNGIYIEDFQFFINSKTGMTYINDPRSVVRGPNGKNIDMLKRLKTMILENALSDSE